MPRHSAKQTSDPLGPQTPTDPRVCRVPSVRHNPMCQELSQVRGMEAERCTAPSAEKQPGRSTPSPEMAGARQQGGSPVQMPL